MQRRMKMTLPGPHRTLRGAYHTSSCADAACSEVTEKPDENDDRYGHAENQKQN
jgi:hypothetical protein